MFCEHQDCLTIVTGFSHAGTTVMTRILIECGLQPLPEVAEELERGEPRHGLEGRFADIAGEYCASLGLADLPHRSREEIALEIAEFPARVVKAPAAACALPELLEDVPRIRHVLIVLRDHELLAERAVQHFGYEDPTTARKDIFHHYGAAFYGCITRPVYWSWIRYPNDFDSRFLGKVLSRAGFAIRANLRDVMAKIWRPRRGLTA